MPELQKSGAAIMNRGFAAVESEFVLTLNNDTKITDPTIARQIRGN